MLNLAVLIAYLNHLNGVLRRGRSTRFGAVIGPTPEVIDDPVRSRRPAFALRPNRDAPGRLSVVPRDLLGERSRHLVPSAMPASSASTSAWPRITGAGRGGRRRCDGHSIVRSGSCLAPPAEIADGCARGAQHRARSWSIPQPLRFRLAARAGSAARRPT